MRTITIIVRGDNDFDIHEGENFASRLCWDEMLGQVASITHPLINKPRYRMQSPEQFFEHQEWLKGICQRNQQGENNA